MAETKELTFSEIAEHNTKKDLYLIVHDKVYDCTSFVDEHPYVLSVASLLRICNMFAAAKQILSNSSTPITLTRRRERAREGAENVKGKKSHTDQYSVSLSPQRLSTLP